MKLANFLRTAIRRHPSVFLSRPKFGHAHDRPSRFCLTHDRFAKVCGWLCEYSVYGTFASPPSAQKARTDPTSPWTSRASAARGCANPNAAPTAMPLPTEAREGCSGLVGEACARQLDGGVDGQRPSYRNLTVSTVTQCLSSALTPRACCLYLPEHLTDQVLNFGRQQSRVCDIKVATKLSAIAWSR